MKTRNVCNIFIVAIISLVVLTLFPNKLEVARADAEPLLYKNNITYRYK